MVVRRRVTNGDATPAVGPFHVHVLGNSVDDVREWPDDGGGYPLRYFPESYSQMYDVAGNKGGINPVSHQSLVSQVRLKPWGGTLGDDLWSPVDIDGLPMPSTGDFTQSFGNYPWGPIIPSSWFSDWSIEAYERFNEQVPVEVSLPNFLYELKDMKAMIPSIDRSVTKTVSNNFLGFEFGVMPFISDVKAIVGLMDSVDKRLKHLLDTQGRETRLRFLKKVEFNEPYSFLKSSNSSPDGSQWNQIKFVRRSCSMEFRIGASLFQDLQDLADAHATMKGLLAAGGFNHPARVIWNAIPYSFVVDWFFHVGKLLDTLSVQPFGGTYDVKDIFHSWKSVSSYDVIQAFGSHQDSTRDVPCGWVTVRRFDRMLGYPASSLFIAKSDLTPMQLALSAAMLRQRG